MEVLDVTFKHDTQLHTQIPYNKFFGMSRPGTFYEKENVNSNFDNSFSNHKLNKYCLLYTGIDNSLSVTVINEA